ncbi:MAG: hypothetical protein ACYS9X_22620 [Planctomycetota bacterium]
MAKKSDAERDGSLGDEEASSVEGELVATVRCVYCSEGMARDVLPRFSRGYGIVVLILGLLLTMFISLLLGLPMVIIGAYMGAANRPVWSCRTCGAVVDRT